MAKHFINASQIDKVFQRQDGSYLVGCTDKMELLVPQQDTNSAFHSVQAWIDDGGAPVIIESVDKKTSVSGGATIVTYTIHTKDGQSIDVVSNREDPEIEETWVQAWEGLGGVISEQ